MKATEEALLKKTRGSKERNVFEELRSLLGNNEDSNSKKTAAGSTRTHSACTDSQTCNIETVRKLFVCNVCFNTSELPAACCDTCLCVIGCIPCTEQWRESRGPSAFSCPLCRATGDYNVCPVINGLYNVLHPGKPVPRSTVPKDTDQSDASTVEYDLSDVDEDDLPPGL